MREQSFFSTLREASFRGIPFEVDSSDEAGGRRLARHEYPLRDTPYAEDLGRKAGEWSVEAFIVQGRKYDYAAARDALRDALKARGPGTLIHPTLGELTVSVDSYRVKESSREGGYCTFSISFVESGQEENPSASADTAHSVRQSGTSARSACTQQFSTAYLPLPPQIPECLAALEEGIALGLDYLSLPLEVLGEGLFYLQSCIALPLQLSGAIFSLFEGLLALSTPGANAYTENRMGSYSPQAVMPAPYRKQQALDNLLFVNPVTNIAPVSALRQHIAEVVVLEDALATANQSFSTGNDALTTRDTVLNGLESLAPRVSDPIFAAFGGVRLAVARDLTTRGGALPQLTNTILPATMPALVAAYTVHGDAKRDAEIVSRNNIRHPGRVPGGIPLEVLSQ